jgi:hypothetical protein
VETSPDSVTSPLLTVTSIRSRLSWESEDRLAFSASVMDVSVGVVGVSADFAQPHNPETTSASIEYASLRFESLFIGIPPLLNPLNCRDHSDVLQAYHVAGSCADWLKECWLEAEVHCNECTWLHRDRWQRF